MNSTDIAATINEVRDIGRQLAEVEQVFELSCRIKGARGLVTATEEGIDRAAALEEDLEEIVEVVFR